MVLLGKFTMDYKYYLMIADFQNLGIDYGVVIRNKDWDCIEAEIYVTDYYFRDAVQIMSNIQAGLTA